MTKDMNIKEAVKPSSTEVSAPKARLFKVDQKNLAEHFWKTFFMIMIPVFFWIFNSVSHFHKALDASGIAHTNYSDLKLSGLAACLFYFIHTTWEQLSYPIVFKYIEDKHQGEERVHRTKRVCKWLMDFFYYSFFTIVAYALFRPIIPTLLLGQSTSCMDAFVNYPAVVDLPWLKEYYLVQLGSHLYKIVDQIFWKRNDVKFWEYFLHHLLAFCLMLHSYIYNHYHVGIVVLITHDITDIFLSIMRAQEAFRYKIPVFFPAFFFLTVFIWTYCRGVVYPYCEVFYSYKYQLTKDRKYGEDWFADRSFLVQLTFLAIMNYYWIYALGAIAIKNVRKMSIKNLMKGKGYDNSYDPTLLDAEKLKASKKASRT